MTVVVGSNLLTNGVNASSSTTVVVTQSDLTPVPNATDWFFFQDLDNTINNSLGSFVTGPGTAPGGDGSAQISTAGSSRPNLATYQFGGTVLANLTELKFSTYNPSAGNGGPSSRSAYLQFNVDFNGSDLWQNRLVYVPRNNGTVVQDSWKEWDAISGGNALWGYSRNTTWPAGVGGGRRTLGLGSRGRS